MTDVLKDYHKDLLQAKFDRLKLITEEKKR